MHMNMVSSFLGGKSYRLIKSREREREIGSTIFSDVSGAKDNKNPVGSKNPELQSVVVCKFPDEFEESEDEGDGSLHKGHASFRTSSRIGGIFDAFEVPDEVNRGNTLLPYDNEDNWLEDIPLPYDEGD